MNNIIKGDFSRKSPKNLDKLCDKLDYLLEEMADVICDDLGEEEGCLFIETLSESIHEIADKLASKVEVTERIEIAMENGDTVLVTKDNGEVE